jgi:hypothetical protein
LLGSMLLGAALRKLLFPTPPPWVAWGWRLPEGLWLAALGAEALLGLWLWWGWLPGLRWGVSLGWFGLLAGVSFWSGWQGAVSCGCLGSGLRVRPWVLLGVDLGAVALLLWGRPAVEAAPRLGRAGLTALAGGLLLLGVALLGLGQLGLGLRELRGQEVVAVPAVWEVAAGEVGTEGEVRGWLRNVGQQVVQVLGGRGDCRTQAVAGLPAVVPPGQEAEVRLRVRRTGPARRFRSYFIFYTDNPSQPQLGVWLEGEVLPGTEKRE